MEHCIKLCHLFGNLVFPGLEYKLYVAAGFVRVTAISSVPRRVLGEVGKKMVERKNRGTYNSLNWLSVTSDTYTKMLLRKVSSHPLPANKLAILGEIVAPMHHYVAGDTVI